VSEWPHAKVFRYGGPHNWIYAGRAGDEKETMPLAVYNGKMYVGTLPSGEVYRYDGETNWSKIARLDLTPDVRYRRVWSMAVFQGRLFAGTLPSGRVHSIEIGKNVTYDTALKAGWSHIVAVKGRERLKLYVNGELVATSSAYRPRDFQFSTQQPLKIGFGPHDYFNGSMCDLRLYRRALTVSEIARLAGN
jgi:outer membrane protein assembly factor BamB